MDDRLVELLESYNVDALRRMALEAGLITRDQRSPTKRWLVDLLAKSFFNRERVEASLAKLSPRERGVFNRLRLHGDRVATDSFERELVAAGLVTTPGGRRPEPQVAGWNLIQQRIDYLGEPGRVDSTIFYDVIARLTLHGLIFSEVGESFGYTYKLNFHPGDTLFIPPAIQPYLPDPEPVAPVTGEWTPARTLTGSAHVYLRELYLYWDYVRKHDAPLLKNGSVGKRSLRAINQTLLEPDPDLEESNAEEGAFKLYSLRLMLQRLGLLQAGEGKLVVPPKDRLAIPDFWLQDTPRQIAECLSLWVRSVPQQVMYVRGQAFTVQTQAARQALIAVLAALPPGHWRTLDVVWTALRRRTANWLVNFRLDIEKRGRGNWYYGSGVSGQPAQLLGMLDQVEENFIRQTVGLFLLQTGLVELGFADATAVAWHAFRLTLAGRAVMAHALDATQPIPPGDAADTGRVVVQPNFQILALGPVSLAVLARLDLFAERRTADIGAFEYHLSRQSVYHAQQSGFTIDAIIDFLTQLNAAELPQNVRRSLQEWGAHHERIVFRSHVSLLQTADPALLQQVQARMAQPLLERELAPTVALVRPGADKQLIAELLGQGLLPAVSDDQPASADHSVTMDTHGLIQPIHSVPSLHLSGRLARIAEQTADGAWRITPASIERAGGDRRRVEQVLAELDKLSAGALAPGLVEQVKRWGHYYGEAAAESLTLIEFFDARTLTELKQHPRVKSLLTPFRAGERALAVVPTHKLAELEALLDELGIPVRRGLKR